MNHAIRTMRRAPRRRFIDWAAEAVKLLGTVLFIWGAAIVAFA